MKPTLEIFSGTESLGIVFKEQVGINIKFIDFNLPLTGAEGRVSANFGGKTRLITVQGAIDGTGFSGSTTDQKLYDFVWTVNNWVNSNVQGSRIYRDSLNNPYNVDCVDFTWTRSNTDLNRLLYSFIFKQVYNWSV